MVAPARKPDNEIALMQTPGGFGTPPFDHRGRELQVRVDGAEIVLSEGGIERRDAIESIAGAAAFVGEGLFPNGLPEDSSPLAIEAPAAAILGEYYAFAAAALSALVATTAPADQASPIIIWPEHFDIAIEAGPEALGRRANYGASPGDELHPEPYVYVGPWQEPEAGELWNATGFKGAELDYAELVAAGDPAALAARFFDVRREALAD